MDTTAIQKPLKQFKKNISKNISVDEIIIYGSQLDGKASTDSDIDVLVISDDFSNVEEHKRFQILQKAGEGIEPYIHAWPFTKKEISSFSKLTLWGHVREKGIRFK